MLHCCELMRGRHAGNDRGRNEVATLLRLAGFNLKACSPCRRNKRCITFHRIGGNNRTSEDVGIDRVTDFNAFTRSSTSSTRRPWAPG